MGIEGKRSFIQNRADALSANDNQESEPGELTRRQMMVASAMNAGSLVAGTTLAAALAKDAPAGVRDFIQERYTEAREAQEPKREGWWSDRTLDVPKGLVGANVDNHLEGSYLGRGSEAMDLRKLPGTMPYPAFHENLGRMLEAKTTMVLDVPDLANAPDQRALYARLGDEYTKLFESQKIRSMDLEGFSQLIQAETASMKQLVAASSDRIVETYLMARMDKLVPAEGPAREKAKESFRKVLDYLVARITPDVMLSYIATEVFPAPNRSMEMLDFLAQHAGVEFIERIPALGDTQPSYGPFQLTPFVIGEKGSVTQLLEVAGQREALPGSLFEFSSMEQHIRAGYLFAFYNQLTLIQDTLKDGHPDELRAILEAAEAQSNGSSSVMLEYLAGAHHRPKVAREIMRDWLAANKDVPVNERATTLYTAAGRGEADQEVARYMEKAEQNSLYLRRFKASQLT